MAHTWGGVHEDIVGRIRAYDASGVQRRRKLNSHAFNLVKVMPGRASGHLDKDDQADRAISTGKRTARAAYTPGLSTWWSTTALSEVLFRGGFPA